LMALFPVFLREIGAIFITRMQEMMQLEFG